MKALTLFDNPGRLSEPRSTATKACTLNRSKKITPTKIAANINNGVDILFNYPTKIKPFYMQPNPDNEDTVLCADLIAPEGYGEIIGGSERINDLELLEQRINEHELDEESYSYYLDLRRYGSVPHSGFGLGLERTVAWISGVEHVRETSPFPRLLNRLYP